MLLKSQSLAKLLNLWLTVVNFWLKLTTLQSWVKLLHVNMAATFMFDINVGRRHKKQQIYRHASHNFDEVEYKKKYKFSMKSLNIITDVIEPELCCTTLRSHPLSAIIKIKLLLGTLPKVTI